MTDQRRYVILDGMRGLAAICILIYHLLQHHGLPATRYGALAVDFFFLLSGFVLAANYDARLGAGMRPAAFLGRRLLRLYPLIFVGMMMGIAITTARVVIVHDVTLTQLVAMTLASLLILPTWALPQYPAAFPANLPMWSMFFELIANAVYAIGFRWWRGWGLAGIIGLSLTGLIALQISNGTIQAGMDKDHLWGGLPRVGLSFFLGVAVARARVGMRLADGWVWPLAAGFVALLLLGDYAPGWSDIPLVLVVMPAFLVVAAAIQPGAAVGRIAGWLGALSFPLYVVHVPILRAGVTARRLPQLAEVPEAAFMAIEVALAFGLAAVLAVTVDGWLRRRIKAWTG